MNRRNRVWSRHSTSGERAGVGKRQRHSDLIGYSAKELAERLRNDKSLSNEERLKIVAELKFWKVRNSQKRSKMSSMRSYTRPMGATTKPHPSALDPVPRHRPRYRWRSWLIAYLPMPLAIRVPMGKRDCGQHEWRHGEDGTDICYHCLVGVRPHQPIDVPIDHDFRVGLVRWAVESGSDVAAAMVEKFHAHDRELGRPRWHPPSSTP